MAQAADSYDAIIIGAGIGGLVCGCYLAKAGMKVLIVEQHHKPGGYCTSFTRKGFTFDAAAHSFGGYREGGIVHQVLTDLDIHRRIVIERHDPSDVITHPDGKTIFWADHARTVSELQELFPSEKKGIEDFFYLLEKPPANFFASNRSNTFEQLMLRYFKDPRLRSVLAFPLFGNGGLPPSKLSAFIGVRIYQEFLLDGGYYPGESMQQLPDALAEQFRESGGDLRMVSSAKKIVVKDNKIAGVTLSNDVFVSAGFVVANCDARRTYLDLLEEGTLRPEFVAAVREKIPSLSMFILYLGIDDMFAGLPQPGTNSWFISHYDLDRAFLSAQEGLLSDVGAMVRLMPHHRALLAYVNAPYLSSEKWTSMRSHCAEEFLQRIEEMVIPGLAAHSVYRASAVPQTLERYTGNSLGAAYGWAGTPDQIAIHELRKPSSPDGLYLAGHWSTQGIGIPGVVYSGFETARTLLKRADNRNRARSVSLFDNV